METKEIITTNEFFEERRDIDPNQVKKKANDIINTSKETRLPISTIEDNHQEIQKEVEIFGIKFNKEILREQYLRKNEEYLSTDYIINLYTASQRLKKDNYTEEMGKRGIPLVINLRGNDKKLITDWLLEQQEIAEREQSFKIRVFGGPGYLPSCMMNFLLTGNLGKIDNKTAREIGFNLLKSYERTKSGQDVLDFAKSISFEIKHTPPPWSEEFKLRGDFSDNLNDFIYQPVKGYFTTEKWARDLLAIEPALKKGIPAGFISLAKTPFQLTIMLLENKGTSRFIIRPGDIPFQFTTEKGKIEASKEAQEIIDKIDEYINTHFPVDEELNYADTPLAKLTQSATRGAIPSMSVAIGLSILTGSPWPGLLILGGVETGGAYERQRKYGEEPSRAAFKALLSGGIEVVTETIPFHFLLQGKIIGSIVTEALQEKLAGLGQNYIDEYTRLTIQEGIEPVEASKMAIEFARKSSNEDALIGGIVGIIGAGVVQTGRGITTVEKVTEKVVGKIPKELIEKGRLVISKVRPVEVPTAEALREEKRETIVQQEQRARMFTLLEEEISPQAAEQLSKGYLTEEEYNELPTKTKKRLEAIGDVMLLTHPFEPPEEPKAHKVKPKESEGAKPAIQLKDGSIITGVNHGEIVKELQEKGRIDSSKSMMEEGFVDGWVINGQFYNTSKMTSEEVSTFLKEKQQEEEKPEIIKPDFAEEARLRELEKPDEVISDEELERKEIFAQRRMEAKITETEQKEIDRTVAAQETLEATNNYLGQTPDVDLDVKEPTEEDIGFIRNFMHKWGIKDKEGYEPIEEKDFRNIYKFLQMPEDIRHAHPEFDGIYMTQRAREVEFAVLNTEFLNSMSPYFKLHIKDQAVVDKALIAAEQTPPKNLKPETLRKMGLNETQQNAFIAVRESLKTGTNLLITRMKETGVKDEIIKDFKKRIINYIPHKWYGNWAVVAKQKVEEGEKSKTIFMSATNYTDRFNERDRIRKLYPDTDVKIIKRTQVPLEAYQAAPSWAVRSLLDTVIERARLDPQTGIDLEEVLNNLEKEKGFGVHFIKRKNIPGWEENLRRPLAQYFTGLAGFLTKTQAIKTFSKTLSNTRKKPNLHRYAIDYIKYVTGHHFEFQHVKRAFYMYYLWANIKSAALNATQNFILGWPVLSKHTNLSLPKLMIAMTRTAIPKSLRADEVEFLKSLEKEGYLIPQLSQEIAGYTGNPMLYHTRGKIQKSMSLFDFFRQVESFNRRSMAIALYNAGIQNIHEAAFIIEEAHFHYGKGNRPVLSRGAISPPMVFRSWGINYILWLKNEIKAGRTKPFVKSIGSLVLLGGIGGLPGWEIIKRLWQEIFEEDPETTARDILGSTAGELLMRGVPTKIPIGEGISFTGSVGQADILPTELKDIPGVMSDIPTRVKRIREDYKTAKGLDPTSKAGRYAWGRILEDASPEFLRNPLAAYRLYKYGQWSRSMSPFVDLSKPEIIKLTKGELAAKTMGFQPEKLSKNYRIAQAIEELRKTKLDRKQNWVRRFVLGKLTQDDDASNEVIYEIMAFNNKMDKQNRLGEKLTKKEWDSLIASTLKATNIPPKHMWPQAKELLEKWEGKQHQEGKPKKKHKEKESK